MKPMVDTFPRIGGSNATGENAMFLRKRRSSNEYSRQNSILKRYSQEELADKMGVSRQAVSKWESEQSVQQ